MIEEYYAKQIAGRVIKTTVSLEKISNEENVGKREVE